ncbi:serine hydrolase [Macrococcus sp. DPC7161]|uniref:serine hydrolase domain-containing protein n=1 Tax=Macrococcus sp. DPC7161 TaxID=2507060 RepID=UPI00100A6056|nr:serine hydrolase domain-containing protein [Macrococcus sp. DPC7161]RXK18814.1 class A beta-lactamase-related serine hydrolase [Macrococcus sp. DPC7161]
MKIKKNVLSLCICLTLLSGCQQTQSAYNEKERPVAGTLSLNASEKTKKIKDLLEKNHFNGSIYIKKNNKIYTGAFGVKSLNSNDKNTINSMFLVGSANKFVTAMLIKQLEKEKLLNVNDKVVQYIPNFPNKNSTILDLILHKSGLKDYKPVKGNSSLIDSIQQINKDGLSSQWINQYHYNDANYIVLAKIVEIVTNQSYEKSLAKYILIPNKLKHTATSNNKVLNKYFTQGMEYKDEKFVSVKPIQVSAYYGAGNLYMSARDFGELASKFAENKLFDKTTTQNMTSYRFINQKYRYGFHIMNGFYRSRGYFFGQDMLTWFNKDYTIVLATNKVGSIKDKSNENLMKTVHEILMK